MAQKYWFFNSASGDTRAYQAADFARYFGLVLTSGLFSLDNQIGLRVRADGTDMRSYVETGKALIKGFAYENDADEYLLHDLPEVTNNRIDRVVLRLDLRNQNCSVITSFMNCHWLKFWFVPIPRQSIPRILQTSA